MANDIENSQKINIRLRENIYSTSDEGFKMTFWDSYKYMVKAKNLEKNQETLLYYSPIVIVFYCNSFPLLL